MSNPVEHDYAPVCDLYHRHLGPALFQPYAVDLARRVACCTSGAVLEMACGTGILTQQLRTHLEPTVMLTATDLNPGMLDYAQKKLKHLDGITWQQADIADLPFPDASFHAVVCQFGLMFVPDKDRAFHEMRRVLVKDGLLAFSVWDRMENNLWGILAHETVGRFFPSNPPQFFTAPCSFHDVDVLRNLLTTHGFDRVEIQAVPEDCLSDTARSLAIGLIEGAPILAEIQERGGSSRPIVEALTAILAENGGDSPHRSTMQAIVATARASG